MIVQKILKLSALSLLTTIFMHKSACYGDPDTNHAKVCKESDLDEAVTLDKCFTREDLFQPQTVANGEVPDGYVCSVQVHCDPATKSYLSWVKCSRGHFEGPGTQCQGAEPAVGHEQQLSRHKRSDPVKAAVVGLAIGGPVGGAIGFIACLIWCDKKSECEKHPQPPVFSKCPPDVYLNQDHGVSAIATWANPVATGRGVSVKRSYGKASGSRFERGSNAVTYTATDKCGRSVFCMFDINIPVISCYDELSKSSTTLQYRCSNPEVVFGGSCTFSCGMGYKLIGKETLVCQKNKKFNENVPTCEVVTCPPLDTHSISNGHYDKSKCSDDYNFMSVCHITCDGDYRANYHSVMICLQTGSWSGAVDTVNSCIDTSPPVFDNCPSAAVMLKASENKRTAFITWPEITASDNSGPVTVQKTGGPPRNTDQPKGIYIEQYEAEDDEGNRAMPCMFVVQVEVITCDASTLFIQDGRFSCDSTDKIYGTTCSFTCEDGYSIQGPSTAKCLDTGSFNTATPTCEKISCPDPNRSGINGQYSSDGCSDDHKYESYCIPTCDAGYRATVSSFIRCKKDGSWTRSLNPCEDVELPIIENCPASKTVYAEPNSKQARVTWPTVTATDNSGSVRVYQLDGVVNNTDQFEGIYTVRITAEDGSGNKARSCVFTINVDVVTCSLSEYLMDRYTALNCTNTKPIRGTTCQVSCWDRATLRGATNITCQVDSSSSEGIWTYDGPEKPRCDPPPANTCPELDAPINGALACEGWIGGQMCTPACKNNSDVPPLNGLDISVFVCGQTSGTWTPVSEVPDCTEVFHPRYMQLPTQFYYFGGDCSDPAVLQTIKENFIRNLNASSFRSACNSLCTVQNVNVKCGAVSGRKKREIVRAIELPNTKILRERKKRASSIPLALDFDLVMPMSSTDTYRGVDTLLVDAAEAIKTECASGRYDAVFNGETIAFKPGSLTYGIGETKCSIGSVLKGTQTMKCVKCPAGFYYDSNKCIDCPVGTYQSLSGQTSCEKCPDMTSTMKVGAKNASYCKESCPPGAFSLTGFPPCDVCKLATYNTQYNATNCFLCPPGYTTRVKGSNSSTDCVEYDLGIEDGSTINSVASRSNISDFTLGVWLYIVRNSGGMVIIQSSDGKASFSISTDLHLEVDGTENTLAESIPNHVWYHFGIVHNASTMQTQLYVNGLQKLQLSGSRGLLIEPGVTLQVEAGGSDIIMKGFLLVLTPMSAEEISTLANRCNPQITEYHLSMNDFLSHKNSTLNVIIPSQCDDVNECQPSPCGSHTTACLNKIGDYECLCQDGYTGKNCDTPPNYCLDHECANGATCKSEETNYTCTCTVQYRGPLCEQPIVNGQWGEWLEWNQCSTTCGIGNRVRRRLCDNPSPQLGGKSCEGISSQQEECEVVKCPNYCSKGSPCGTNGICTDTLDGPVCQCINDFTGQKCDQPPDYCNGHVCQNNATCVHHTEQRNYTCQCTSGFAGDLCNHEIVNGGWSDWSWGSCSVTCGGGIQSGKRTCVNPKPNKYGQPCEGVDVETRACNNEECPKCPNINRPIDGNLNCSETDGLKTCIAFCNEGYAFAPGQISTTVHCGRPTNYSWTDEDRNTIHSGYRTVRLPACGAVKKPQQLTAYAQAKYKTTPCSDISRCTEAKEKVKEKTKDLPCVKDKLCIAETKFSSYDSIRSKRSTQETVQIILTSVYSPNETTWSEDQAERENEVRTISTTIESFENTVKELMNNTDQYLQLNINGVVYEIDETSLTISGSVTCGEGSVSYGPVCIECPSETRKVEDSCITCERGTYQGQSGASACHQCPIGYSTISTGSESIDNCTVEVSTTTASGVDDRTTTVSVVDDRTTTTTVVDAGTATTLTVVDDKTTTMSVADDRTTTESSDGTTTVSGVDDRTTTVSGVDDRTTTISKNKQTDTDILKIVIPIVTAVGVIIVVLVIVIICLIKKNKRRSTRRSSLVSPRHIIVSEKLDSNTKSKRQNDYVRRNSDMRPNLRAENEYVISPQTVSVQEKSYPGWIPPPSHPVGGPLYNTRRSVASEPPYDTRRSVASELPYDKRRSVTSEHLYEEIY